MFGLRTKFVAPHRRTLYFGGIVFLALVVSGLAWANPPITSRLSESPSPSSSPAPTVPARAIIVTIQGEINDITLVSLKRRVEDIRQAGATMLVLEMDTPGGLAGSALEICTYLKKLTGLKSVAWVNPSAYSAGAMISLACDEIVVSSSSKFGDCAPIMFSPTEGLQQLGETERAKAESPILKEFIDSAHRRRYDPLLCEAMVRVGNEVWWLENKDTGERKFVSKVDKEALVKDGGAWRLVTQMHDPVSGMDLPARQPVVSTRDLLTLTQSEAVAYGFAKAIISSEEELRAFYGISGPIIRHTPNWAEELADFLCSPIVRTILVMLIAMGAYAEFQAPGHFVGGAVALVALLIFLGAPYLTGLANLWEILLVLVGLILLAIELFVVPGFGILGLLGIMLILLGLIATFVPTEPGPVIIPQMPATWSGLKTGLEVVLEGMALSLVGMWFLNKYLTKIPVARGLVLSPPSFSGTVTTPAVAAATGKVQTDTLAALRVGDNGRTLTRLRPAGKALINGRRWDVIAQGQMLEVDVSIEVVEMEGGRIVVREKH